MASDPTKLNDLEMLSLLALGLIPFMEQVIAGEKDPFPYPEALLSGFNQLSLICALRDVPRAQRPTSIPDFVATWAILPLSEWVVKLDIPVDMIAVGDRLLDPEYDGRPTALCKKLSRGEAIGQSPHYAIADGVVGSKEITIIHAHSNRRFRPLQ